MKPRNKALTSILSGTFMAAAITSSAALASFTHVHADDMLVAAAANGHTSAIRPLLWSGADIHYQDDEALRRAVMNGHPDTAATLLQSDADIHADAALLMAALIGDADVVETLLNHGADIHV